MEGSKNKSGRPQVYNGEKSELAQRMEARRRQQNKTVEEPELRTAEAADVQRGQETGQQAEAEPQKKERFGLRRVFEKKESGSKEPSPKASESGMPGRDRLEKRVSDEKNAGRRSGLGSTAAISRRAAAAMEGKRKREQENILKMQTLAIVLGILVLILIGALVYEIGLGHGTKQTGNERMAAREAEKQKKIAAAADRRAGAEGGSAEDGQENASGNSGKKKDGASDAEKGGAEGEAMSGPELLKRAERMAAQYDYDGAIELLKQADGYEEDKELLAAVSAYEEKKAECVPYSASDVTHIFFHTLIHDPTKAFDGDQYQDGYNQNMVTEHEFNSIIQQMYDRGYVMVFLDELVKKTEDSNGNTVFAGQDIMLPPDKIPFVLSQDDVCYYHYMDGDGFASRLIVDENGAVKNEYIEEDGSVSVGDYDLVPLIDRFVEQHPDFSYHGQKGYLALTGYEGILGYRTDEVYKTKQPDRITFFQQQFFDSYPGGFDEAAFEHECEEAKKVAEAMKAEGWKFASHTWGHQNMHETNGISYEKFQLDTDRWEAWVEPLVGETDTLIYAFGGDIRGAEAYAGDRFNYLKQCGFDYFCGVDSAKHWLQVGTDYVRQSRRNVDGYRMFYNPDLLSDLFDVSAAWDPLRPESVPQI